ncbi:unnamed protein product, partial [Amoebophrya sp. A25]
DEDDDEDFEEELTDEDEAEIDVEMNRDEPLSARVLSVWSLLFLVDEAWQFLDYGNVRPWRLMWTVGTPVELAARLGKGFALLWERWKKSAKQGRDMSDRDYAEFLRLNERIRTVWLALGVREKKTGGDCIVTKVPLVIRADVKNKKAKTIANKEKGPVEAPFKKMTLRRLPQKTTAELNNVFLQHAIITTGVHVLPNWATEQQYKECSGSENSEDQKMN